MDNNVILEFIEIIGTIAFAISGSMTAINCELDLFGTLALGIITSTFGGVFRDLILAVHPPCVFIDPKYVITAAVVSLLVFVIVYIKRSADNVLESPLLFWMDSLGLGIFSVMGVLNAYQIYGAENGLLLVFCGLITGVGGGLLRDICVNRLPAIFVRHIYAIAAIVGSVIILFFVRMGYIGEGIWFGVSAVLALRYFASTYKWNLPRISKE